MKIGDKVRVLSGSEEGRVVAFKDKNLVEIEIEDGFTIPVMASDLVVVAQEESEYFDKETPEHSKAEKTSISKKASVSGGIFLGFIPINENDLTVNLYNHSENDFLYNLSEKHEENLKSLSHGKIEAGKSVFITYMKLDTFDQWPSFLIQLITINNDFGRSVPFYENLVKPRAKTFFKSKKLISGEEKEGFVVSLKNEINVEVNKLMDSFYEQKDQESHVKTKARGGDRTVDLHIEQLKTDFHHMPKEEILQLQITSFEQELDRATAEGANSIKFIHGIGNGSLRHAIHKYLSKADHIKYFEDSDKGKFGYGATTVYF